MNPVAVSLLVLQSAPWSRALFVSQSPATGSSAPSAAADVSACDLLRGDSVNRQKLLEWDGSVFFPLLFYRQP